MRLIDADLFLEELNRFSMRITGSANAMALAVMYETKKSIVKMVEEQPTAYDVDKVVEQLKKEFIKNYGNQWDKAPYLVKSIEIVKSGGIDKA